METNIRKSFADLVNVTICVSVLSIGLSAVYAGSRTLTAMAETGYAPKVSLELQNPTLSGTLD